MYTVFINGNIYIEQETFCQAMAVSDGLIRATGSNQEVLRAAPADAAVVDLEGRTVIPGLNDSHLHLTMVVSSRMQADLRGATSIEEIISRCKNFLRDHPELCKAGLQAFLYEVHGIGPDAAVILILPFKGAGCNGDMVFVNQDGLDAGRAELDAECGIR